MDSGALRELPAEEQRALDAVVHAALAGCKAVQRPESADVVALFRSSDPALTGGPGTVVAITGLERQIYPDLYAADAAGAKGREREIAVIAGAQAIAVPSEVARRDVIARVGRVAADVVNVGAPQLELRPTRLRRIPRQAVVVPGAVGPHRNAESVIAAYAELPPAVRHRHRLVLGTRRGDLRKHLLAVARAAGVPAATAAPIPACLAHASLAVFPGFWDGYSPGAAEALAAGVPIAASTATAAAEIAADQELLFDPRDARSLARVLARALDPARPAPPRQPPSDAGAALRGVWESVAAQPRGAPSPEPATVGFGRPA